MQGDKRKKRKLMCLSYAVLLVVCFFLPVVGGCKDPSNKYAVPAILLLSDQHPACDT